MEERTEISEKVLSLPEQEAMYYVSDGRVLVLGYLDDGPNYERARMPESDPRFSKYSKLEDGQWGYATDEMYKEGKLSPCMWWDDERLRPTLTVDDCPQLAAIREELMKNEAPYLDEQAKIIAGNPLLAEAYPIPSAFENMQNEVSIFRCVNRDKEDLMKKGILTDDMCQRYKFLFDRHRDSKDK